MPSATIRPASRRISRSTCDCRAPSAIRTPISPVRRATLEGQHSVQSDDGQGQRKPGRGSRSDDMHPVALELSCGAERAHPRQ